MFKISHRGNIHGRNEQRENDPDYIIDALNKGYDVEVDVRYIDGEFFLGHDKPKYPVPINFLTYHKLWCHAKNIDALRVMLNCDIHCFWHETDRHTLTSKGYIWTYPGEKLTTESICLFPEKREDIEYNFCKGICSDFIGESRYE